MKTHVQSRYHTDTMSRTAMTVCGISVPVKNTVRFKSDSTRGNGCGNCQKRTEV